VSKKKRPPIPRFEQPIIETHCHLDYLEESQLEQTLQLSSEVGIERIITIAVSAENLATVRQLTQCDDRIWGTQGIHPHEAESFNKEVELEMRQHLPDDRILAVGEIGLDYYYDHADRQVQRDVFEQQLQIACDHKLPVVIHTREADEDTRDILANFSGSLQAGGVIHSFTSGLPLAEYCLEQGFCLGFNGIATFRQADNVREVVAITPPEKILLETDAPYLTPVPYRGKPNAPYYLPFIAERIAEVKGYNIEVLLQQAYRNSIALFFPDEHQQET
jgi:TatD DNase family protein